MRRYAREVAFCRIYEFILNGCEKSETDFGLFEEKNIDEGDKKYIDEIYAGVTGHFGQLTEMVSDYSKSFKLERIFKTDLAALALALYEIDYTDTPAVICVNEAAEIAKKFSSEKSSGFVNGLLAGYLKAKSKELKD